LRILKYRGDFYRIRNRIPDAAVDPQTRTILTDFEAYFNKFPEHEKVDIVTFLPIFRARHTGMKEETRTAYEAIIKSVSKDVDEDTKSGVMTSLLELRLGTSLAGTLAKWDAGEEPNIHASLRAITDEFERDADIKSLDFLRPDIDDLLSTSLEENGLRWRLECLRSSMRGLRPGDFGIIAGRPDKGKTTFIASETTYLAPQLPDDRTVVWLNNEGPGDRIYLRIVQAALGMTLGEIREFKKTNDIMETYSKLVGDKHRIRIVDIHGRDTYEVENIIRANNAGLVVYDMIDKIRGFGDAARTDLMLEAMYDWARELCVKYELVGLATSQISNEGDGMQFPTLGMLKDSKTGKQGACDFQLMIGASNDVNLAGYRYIGLPKNKLRREGAAGDPRATVNFKPQIARFDDLPIDPTHEE
jgi:replicative DNA helicase